MGAMAAVPVHIVKRDGRDQEMEFDNITKRISGLCGGLDPAYVDPIPITQKVVEGLYSGISSAEIQTLAAETCAYMSQKHHDFSTLAARIAASNLHFNGVTTRPPLRLQVAPADVLFYALGGFKPPHRGHYDLVRDGIMSFLKDQEAGRTLLEREHLSVAVRIRVRSDTRGNFGRAAADDVWRLYFDTMRREVEDDLRSLRPALRLAIDIQLSQDESEKDVAVLSSALHVDYLASQVVSLQARAVVLLAGPDRIRMQKYWAAAVRLRMWSRFCRAPTFFYSMGTNAECRREMSATDLRRLIEDRAASIEQLEPFLPERLDNETRAQVIRILRSAGEDTYTPEPGP